MNDDPELSARPWGRRKMHRQPWRVVLDPALVLPRTLKLFDTTLGGPTVIACAKEAELSSKEALRRLGHHVWEIPRREDGQLSLKALMERMAKSEIQSVLIEPGATLASSALIEEPIVDLVHIFLAPKFLGGSDAPSLLGGPGLDRLNLAKDVDVLKIGRKGPDIHLVLRPSEGFGPDSDQVSAPVRGYAGIDEELLDHYDQDLVD
jgi:diaminohydroxyphosphoribosylaminopyrimidine deaminase/5-amino-6-(5-phosphoribosylamino)uracil reductase